MGGDEEEPDRVEDTVEVEKGGLVLGYDEEEPDVMEDTVAAEAGEVGMLPAVEST